MRIAKRFGIVPVAVLAVSAIAVSSASAGLPVFLSHPLGLLLGAAEGNQVWTFGSITFACTALKLLPPGDTTTSLTALGLLAVVEYQSCVASGFVFHILPIRYFIDANGLVRLESTALILGAEGCVITIPSGSNQSLQTVKFANIPGGAGVLLLTAIEGITMSGVGGLCEFATTKATLAGNVRLTLDSTPPGGILKWDLNA